MSIRLLALNAHGKCMGTHGTCMERERLMAGCYLVNLMPLASITETVPSAMSSALRNEL